MHFASIVAVMLIAGPRRIPTRIRRAAKKLVWQRKHEQGTRQSSVPMHVACLTQHCNRCIELWGCNMHDYLLSAEKHEPNRSAYEKFGLRGSSSGSSASGACNETPLRRSTRLSSNGETNSHSLTPRGDDRFDASDGRVSVTTTTTTISFPATAANVYAWSSSPTRWRARRRRRRRPLAIDVLCSRRPYVRRDKIEAG